MLKEKILVVDDEQGVRNTLTSILEDEGYGVCSVESGEECLKTLGSEHYHAVMLDVWLPGIDGIETLKRMRSMGSDAAVVMISGHGTVETAVRATKLGAFDFIEKPLSLEKIILVLRNAIRHKRLLEKHKILKEQLRKDIDLIGESTAINQLRKDVEAVATTDSPLLITGENGSGKELAARLIHFKSKRSEESFISINCAAFEADTLERELFGYEKGVLPLVSESKKGSFGLANEGTVFLDDISEASMKIQTKIFRMLEEKSYEPIGSERAVQTDVRVIAASAKDLGESIKTGKLREDLCDKLTVITLRIPPLRERRDDIQLLTEHFLRSFSYEYGRGLKSLEEEALHALKAYSWPGNVRELKNTIERLVIMLMKDTIKASDLPESIRRDKVFTDAREFKSLEEAEAEFEKRYMQKVLQLSRFDLKRASEILKISPNILEEKIKLHGLR